MIHKTNKLTPRAKSVALHEIARKFKHTYMQERQEEDTVDKMDVFETAKTIDPNEVSECNRSEFYKFFGDNTHATFDFGETCACADFNYSPDGKIKSVSIFENCKTAGEFDKFECPISSANRQDDLVKIRIKTGKGGRATFWVKQSVAGDFVGCD